MSPGNLWHMTNSLYNATSHCLFNSLVLLFCCLKAPFVRTSAPFFIDLQLLTQLIRKSLKFLNPIYYLPTQYLFSIMIKEIMETPLPIWVNSPHTHPQPKVTLYNYHWWIRYSCQYFTFSIKVTIHEESSTVNYSWRKIFPIALTELMTDISIKID